MISSKSMRNFRAGTKKSAAVLYYRLPVSFLISNFTLLYTHTEREYWFNSVLHRCAYLFPIVLSAVYFHIEWNGLSDIKVSKKLYLNIREYFGIIEDFGPWWCMNISVNRCALGQKIQYTSLHQYVMGDIIFVIISSNRLHCQSSKFELNFMKVYNVKSRANISSGSTLLQWNVIIYQYITIEVSFFRLHVFELIKI